MDNRTKLKNGLNNLVFKFLFINLFNKTNKHETNKLNSITNNDGCV